MGGDGTKSKIEKNYEKIYKSKHFTCKRYWSIESSRFWNRFRSQNFRHFWAFSSIRPFFNGLFLFFPYQIEPPAHHGSVLKKILTQKNSFENDCISPRYKSYHQYKGWWTRNSEVLPRDGCEPALTQMNCENFIKFSNSLSVSMDSRRKRNSRYRYSRSSNVNKETRPVSKRCSGIFECKIFILFLSDIREIIGHLF